MGVVPSAACPRCARDGAKVVAGLTFEGWVDRLAAKTLEHAVSEIRSLLGHDAVKDAKDVGLNLPRQDDGAALRVLLDRLEALTRSFASYLHHGQPGLFEETIDAKALLLRPDDFRIVILRRHASAEPAGGA